MPGTLSLVMSVAEAEEMMVEEKQEVVASVSDSHTSTSSGEVEGNEVDSTPDIPGRHVHW